MNFFVRPAVAAFSAATVLLLAGCGGGGGHSGPPALPPGSGLPVDSGLRVPQVLPPPTTLYVSGVDRVNAFAATAAGTTPPSRTINVHPNQVGTITAIATRADAKVDVLQNFRNSPGGPSMPNAAGNYSDCRVVIKAADANGNAGTTDQFECYPNPGNTAIGVGKEVTGSRGLGIARGPNGEVDYLETILGYPGFNDTTVVAGHNSVKAIQATTTGPDNYGGIDFSGSQPVTTFSQLTTLSTDYNVITGTCGFGSPRFNVRVTNGTKTGYILFSLGPCGTGWQNTGNMADPSKHVDYLDVGGSGFEPTDNSSNGDTVAAAQSKYGSYTVDQIFLIVDPSNGTQTVQFDNTLINSKLYAYENAYPADVVQRSDQFGNLNGYIQLTPGAGPTPLPATPQAGTPKTHHGITEAAGGHIYVSSGGVIPSGTQTAACDQGTSKAQVDNYLPGAATNDPPVHTFTIIGRVAAGALAIAPDNSTLYVATCDGNGLGWVDAMTTPGADGPQHPAKSLGPFPNGSVTALAVDSQGNLYVGLTDKPVSSSPANHVRVYAPTFTSGKPPPLRILQNPLPPSGTQRITGLSLY